jgi:hypothetical protein
MDATATTIRSNSKFPVCDTRTTYCFYMAQGNLQPFFTIIKAKFTHARNEGAQPKSTSDQTCDLDLQNTLHSY